jgi:choline dehydrogenase-like flavoprotein
MPGASPGCANSPLSGKGPPVLLDLRELPDDTAFEADVCVVGAGPAGIALTEALASAGLQVVLLESGGLQLDADTQALNDGEIAGLPHPGVQDGRGRAVGGSAKLWAGQCLTLDPIDFERRDWVPYSGWPAAARKLDPYYRRAEAFFQVDNEVYDEANYRKFGLAPPAWDSAALRTHFTVYTPEVDTGRFHLQRLRRDAGIRVVIHASVVRIETNAAVSRAETVHARSLTGRRCTVRAGAFVLCAGGMENARLLLLSNQQQNTGLGNGRDLVGRFLQDHPNGLVATLQGGDLRDLQDRFRLLYRGRKRYFPKFALSPTVQRARRVLNGNAHLVFGYPGQPAVAVMRELLDSARRRRLPSNPLRQAGLLLADTGNLAHILWRRYRHGRSPAGIPTDIKLQCYLEQAPNPDSRVMLSDQRDALGLPRLRSVWCLAEIERETLRVLAHTVSDEFRRLGMGDMRLDPWLDDASDGWAARLSDAYHHAGTTRMAEDPSQGVVDSDGQVFGIAGLYACGGSVFPTSGYANPTLTIVALALRLADHLRATVKEASRPVVLGAT